MIGAVLAGGRGTRLGAPQGKAMALLGGRPLVAYPVAALAEVCERVAVVCKPDTVLPDVSPAERWDERAEPRHPLTGIVHALERAPGAVLTCAADMPFVTPEACRSLVAATGRTGAPAVLATVSGVLQPLFGVYDRAALALLEAPEPDAPLTRTVERLGPARLALPELICRSVNTPADLAEAEASIADLGSGAL